MAEFKDDVTAKYADRIAKLLAKAESTNHSAEADSLFAKAQELMTEHNITAAMLAEAGSEAADILSDGEMYFTGVFRKVTMRHAFIVARYNNVQTVYREGMELGTKQAIRVSFFGFKSDIANVELLVNSLQLQCAQAMQRWCKTDEIFAMASTPMEKFKEKREFIIGFQNSIETRLHEAREAGRRAAAAAAAERNKSTMADAASKVALVVQSKEDMVTEGFHQRYPRLGKGRSGAMSRGSANARGAGQAAGARANMGGGTSIRGGGKALGR
jgi:hypothetical protein